MAKNSKRKSIVTKVVLNMAIIISVGNLFLISVMWYVLDVELGKKETEYMSEVISRVTLEINSELNNYVVFSQGIAQSYILNQFLQAVEQETVEGHGETFDAFNVEGYQDTVEELQIAANMFSDSVRSVNICSIYKDNFLNNEGKRGDENFTLSSLPYYEVVNTRSTYITDAYQDVLTGDMIIAIAEPMFDSQGAVYGIVAIEISTEQLAKIAEATTFGDSGSTYLLDKNLDVLTFPDSSYVGKSVFSMEFTGDEFIAELNNPTGQIIEYERNSVARTGGVSKISNLSGWTMVSSMDSAEFETAIENVVTFLVLAQLMVLIFVVICCSIHVYRCLFPMKQLETFMEEFAEGNLKSSVDYDLPNEIGRLAEHMNRTAKTLSGYIYNIDETMKRFQEGDFYLPENMEYKGDFQSIQHSMERFVQMMSKSLGNLDQSIQEVNQGALQMTQGAQLLASGSAEQAGSVEGLHRLIGNINSTIMETAENSSSVTENAEHISSDLLKSNEKMQELVISVKNIRAMSDEVKRIIKTIEEVAFQTNILSLNASVEAARAGSAGRGFAVVADQVRILSGSTAEAAEQTTKIINDIATAIETGSDLAQSTSHDLQAVVDEVGHFVEKISNISLSAQDQVMAIEEISRGVENISDVVQKNSSISEESAAASQELTTQSDVMMSLVKQFHLEDTSVKRGF